MPSRAKARPGCDTFRKMKRYEYVTFSFPPKPPFFASIDHAALQAVLSEWGAQGWELVNATTTNHRLGRTREVLVVLKRELVDRE